MSLTAILFGGIGSLAECAEQDRLAWNGAFRAHGLAWDWSWDTYAELMRPGGDRQLAARFAAYMGVDVAARRLADTRTRLFSARLASGVPLRAGVGETLAWAARSGMALGLVSRAEPGAVHALLGSTARARGGIEFDAVVTSGDACRLAPYPDGMELALERLGRGPCEAIAVVDTPAAAAAALDAGLSVLAVPGLLAEDQVFPAGCRRVGALSPDEVISAYGGTPSQAAE
ncbi:HAD hydrolase-like protein [Rhodobacterales bacterium HKCCE2091]|nr:HAD hydrolase-like protein [Rhodobacterales bacterium HKCCE2091]